MSTLANATALPVPPLAPAKARLAAELVQGLDGATLTWLSGYMAGAAARLHGAPAPAATAPAASVDLRLTVLYGSQTGNAKRVAERLAREAEAVGLAVRLVRADAYRTHELQRERLLYVVISTHSTGDTVEPPDDARGLVDFLLSRRAPKLPKLRYAVLALGDTSYPDFCGIGRRVDERLAELGAARVQARGEADVDIDGVAEPWSRDALKHARDTLGEATAPQRTPVAGVVTPLHATTPPWSRQHPFAAEVLVNQRIVANASGKDIRHIELSLAASGITYASGDALGIWPTQATELVRAILDSLQLDGDVDVAYAGEHATLTQWLTARRELTTLTRPFLAAHAQLGHHAELAALLEPDARTQLAALFDTHQVLDVLRRWQAPWNAGDLVATLRPLAPRMYSIASSQHAVGEEVHLTVARLQYAHAGEVRWGVATRHLCALEEGDTLPVFIEPNSRFHLPADPTEDVIMIGPGTGVAPFRAFVQERQATGATGRLWLFFGNPHRRTDFLYQREWQQALRDGALSRLSVAFSRDNDTRREPHPKTVATAEPQHKVYVQDRLREQGREVWSWLEAGARVYVCGNADRMAPDVHAALVSIAAEHGGKSHEDADALLGQWMAEGRYARDIY